MLCSYRLSFFPNENQRPSLSLILGRLPHSFTKFSLRYATMSSDS